MCAAGHRLHWKNEVEKLFLQQSTQLSPIIGFLPYLLILVIFYFLLIRPGTTRQKKLQEMIDNLKVGDKIVTGSGIYGTIMGFKNDRIQVRIAENVKVEMARNAVTALQNPEEE
jgi:preprotein translocase subunit YajC